MTYRQGDARDLTKEIEDDCDYLVGREVAKGNAQVVPTGQTTDATVAPTTARDSGPEKKQDALQELNSLIGLEKVKHEIKKMINMVEFNKKRIASGKAPESKPCMLPLWEILVQGKPLWPVCWDKCSLMRVFSQGKNSVSWKQRSPI